MGLALEEPNGNEVATPINGIDVLISDEVKSLTENSTVDYLNGPNKEGFTIGVAGQSCC